MRSDAAPALSQAIAPTWTGNHTFTPASGTGILVNGVASSYAVDIIGSSTSTHSLGLALSAGTTSADVAMTVSNQAASVNYFQINGDGGVTLNGAADEGLGTINVTSGLFINASTVPAVNQSPTWTGNHTFTPASGIALSVSGSGETLRIAGDSAIINMRNSSLTGVLQFGSVNGWIGSGGNVTDAAIGAIKAFNLYVNGAITPALNVSTAGNFTIAAPSSGTALTVNGLVNTNLAEITDGTQTFTVQTAPGGVFSGALSNHSYTIMTNNASRIITTNTGNVTVNAPTSGVALTVSGVGGASGSALNVVAPATASQSFGAVIFAGTNTSDYGLRINNAANTLNYWTFLGDGSLVSGGLTSKGIGTINATGLFVNGVSVGTAAGFKLAQGQFNCTSGGCTPQSGTTAISFTSRGAVGVYTMSMSGASFSGAPACTVNAIASSNAHANINTFTTTTVVVVQTWSAAGSAADEPFSITCIGT